MYASKNCLIQSVARQLYRSNEDEYNLLNSRIAHYCVADTPASYLLGVHLGLYSACPSHILWPVSDLVWVKRALSIQSPDSLEMDFFQSSPPRIFSTV